MSDLLKNKFADYEPEPDSDIWDGIEMGLLPLKNKFTDFEAEPERDVWAGIESSLFPLKGKFADFEAEPERDVWAGIESNLLPLKSKFANFEAEPERDVWAGIESNLFPLKSKFADFEAEPERDVWAGIESNLFPLKSKFANFEAEPERNVWLQIEKELQPQTKVVPIWGMWKPWLAAASVVLILMTSVIFMRNKGTDDFISPTDIAKIDSPTSKKNLAIPSTISEEAVIKEETTVADTDNPNPTSTVANEENKNIKQRTKVYIVKVTESYDASKEKSAQNPIVTNVEKHEVQQPVVIAPAAPKKEEPQIQNVATAPLNNNPKIADKPEEVEEWIVYEMPKKKKEVAKKQTIFPQNTNNEVLNLNSMDVNDLAAFSAQKLNKVINTPVKVNQKNGNTMYEVNLGGIKIQHKATKKVEREY